MRSGQQQPSNSEVSRYARARWTPLHRTSMTVTRFASSSRSESGSTSRQPDPAGVEFGNLRRPTLSARRYFCDHDLRTSLSDPILAARHCSRLYAVLLVFDKQQADEALHVCVCVNDTVCLNHDGVQLHFVACAVDGSLRERREQDRSISSFRWCSPRWRSAISSRRFMTVSRKGSPTGARGHVAARGGQTRSPQLMLSYSRF